ncbi:MAG: hypothetical protein M1479_09335 [Actinobacteria bacterium]|nr:hypothetical protein [Cyanobacteriota bacterium]MCL5772456.1 hypothetical protein [Actinomycetota bacterium]
MEKREFIDLIKGELEMINSGEHADCTCPVIKCKWHGNCYECVMMHRVHQKHLPNCLKPILDKKVMELAKTLEMHLVSDEEIPDEYWDSVNYLFDSKNDNK